MNKLSISIVNWNTGDLLAKCLASLVALPESERTLIDEVVVVDNNSHDNSIAKAKVIVGQSINQPRVRFVQLDYNAGFTGGNNLALERILERNGIWPHVLLLNPDTEVRAGAIGVALEEFGRDAKVGVVGPQLLNPDLSIQPSVRSFPTFQNFLFFFLKLNRYQPKAPSWKSYMKDGFDYSISSNVDQVMGAAFFIRDEVLQAIGLLDNEFFFWFEEVDYCKRVIEGGWLVRYLSRGQVIHHGGVSFNQLGGWRKSWRWTQSSLAYARKHLKSKEWIVLVLVGVTSMLITVPIGGLVAVFGKKS